MKILVQRTGMAKVIVDGKSVGEINKGLLLYVCLEKEDTKEIILEAAEKVAKLRIFEDEAGKMNHNISQSGGKILSVSQFTLSWDGRKGHRPSFDQSMPPQEARLMYALFNQRLKEFEIDVETGRFGADMQVTSLNDGPVTFHLSFGA